MMRKTKATYYEMESTYHNQLLPCPDCDLMVTVEAPSEGVWLRCPRCQYPLVRQMADSQSLAALSVTALVLFVVVLLVPYIGFSRSGVTDVMSVQDAATQLLAFDFPVLGILVMLAILLLPAGFLAGLLWVLASIKWRQGQSPLPGAVIVMRLLATCRTWIMADVFAIGVLVSLIKIAGMAEVRLLAGFWAYAAFSMVLLLVIQRFRPWRLWGELKQRPRVPAQALSGEGVMDSGLMACLECGQIQQPPSSSNKSPSKSHCCHCHARLHSRHPNSLQHTWAFLLAAFVCCFPAHLLPVMVTTQLGSNYFSTIIGGVLLFMRHGDWPIAVIVFVASVMIPFGKIIALAWLCLTARFGNRGDVQRFVRLYRATEWVGRWSMIDVFVVSVVVALVQLGSLMSVRPGAGGLAFAAVVVLTMLGAQHFDPRLLWDKLWDTWQQPADESRSEKAGQL